MTFVISAIFVFVGLLTGWLAGRVMTRGGYGLPWDLTLGLEVLSISV
jgi:uncharacterized membrane protein YeaQ/YmgE (transglycosylase-associated protein family)